MKWPLLFDHRPVLFWLLLGLGSCAADPPGSNSFDDCLYGAPEAIFDESVSGVTHHSFKLKANKSLEQFLLNDRTKVRIEQTGCDHLEQEFTFSWRVGAARADSEYVVQETIRLFQELGELGAPYLSFSAIGGALEQSRKNWRINGQSMAIQPGLYFNGASKRKNGELFLTIRLYEPAEK